MVLTEIFVAEFYEWSIISKRCFISSATIFETKTEQKERSTRIPLHKQRTSRATIKINDALIGAVVYVQCVAVGERATVLYLAATPVLHLILSTRVRSHLPTDWAILSKLSDPVKYYNLWQERRRALRGGDAGSAQENTALSTKIAE